ncbi:4Fe-4S binding protein [Halomonas campisalis]|uniref:4Fe-4S binding protein n=1 Tax=Billgrantia campisalis TaxID=74661 RepID=A0ABS9P7N0_9GAMM|nr:ferredoxin family protein [Halomonas campisalis]MCG6657797.1 4Fe-4S binding protein [Halomonas campisalis]MDR5864731.1 4Fe-4S binding protein [Halomonas campisalis]
MLTQATTPQPLRKSRLGIGWLAPRCLEAPPHPLACTHCRNACPAEALAFHEDVDGGFSLLASDACHGCAQCVAACPTEALVSAEIQSLLDAGPAGAPLRLGCHRTVDAPDQTRLHCLRALGPDLLAWLSARATPGELELRLPDACRGCLAAPKREHDAWLEQARAICTLRESEAKRDYTAAGAAVSRRGFLLGQGSPRLATIADDDTAPRARRLARQAAAAEALDGRFAPPLPGLSLQTDACRAHGVCARVCPTEALQETPEGELRFDPLACLDCGHCLTACPEQALSMTGNTSGDTRTLRHDETARCFRCRRPFTRRSADQSSECPACRRENALMKESFHDLFE